MIKKFKIFETNENAEPKVGDWIVCNSNNKYQNYNNFIISNVGKLQEIRRSIDNQIVEFWIYYDGLEKVSTPPNIMEWSNVIIMYIWNIQFWSLNKKTCEIFIETNKYNL